jgi:steroid delta-isomerase-like uncharacterized protein
MSAEDNKALVRRFVEEVFNQGNVDAIAGFLAEGFADYNKPPGLPPGLEGMEQWYAALLDAFPDLHYEIEDLLAEGDKVVMRSTWRGTHSRPLLDIPATGKTVISQGIDILRVVDGKFVARWGHTDAREMLAHLREPAPPAPTPIHLN